MVSDFRSPSVIACCSTGRTGHRGFLHLHSIRLSSFPWHARLFLHLNICEKCIISDAQWPEAKAQFFFSYISHAHDGTDEALLSSGNPTVLSATVSKIHIFDVLLKIYIHSSALKRGSNCLNHFLHIHIYKSRSNKRK